MITPSMMNRKQMKWRGLREMPQAIPDEEKERKIRLLG